MNYKKIVLFKLLLFSSASSSLKAFDISQLSRSFTTSSVLNATGVVAGLYFGYTIITYAYTQIKEYYENKVLNEIVDALLVSVIPNNLLQEQLCQADYESALKKKAQLVAMRKRIIEQLEKILKNPQQFSDKHYKKMQGDLALAKTTFNLIDIFRPENKFERHQHIITLLDTYVDDQIIATYILMSKPRGECTTQELQERELKSEKRQKIITLLKSKLQDNCEQFFTIAVKLIYLITGTE